MPDRVGKPPDPGHPFKEISMSQGAALKLTDDTFTSQIEDAKGLAIVDFWAAWCGPCRMVGPIVEQIATEYADQGVIVGKVDVDSNPRTTARFNVRSIPSILFFKDGKLVDTVVGAVPKVHLEQKIAHHK
jgi:thioredoxin 1